MKFDQKYFSKTIKNFGKFVTKVLSGTNEEQKKMLKVNLQAFQNLCDSHEMVNQNGDKNNEREAHNDESVIRKESVGKRQSDSNIEVSHEHRNKQVKLDPKRKVELPDEIWMKILSYVNSTDLFQNVTLVCQRFYNIHRSAVQYLEIESFSLQNKRQFKSAKRILSQCNSLKLFKIKWMETRTGNPKLMVSYMNEMIKQVLVSAPNLKMLGYPTVHDHQFMSSHLETKTVEAIGTLGKQLEHLEVDHALFFEGFNSNFNDLKSLFLKNFTSSSDISSLSKKCPKLESIRLDFLRILENENISIKVFEDFFSKMALTALKEVSFQSLFNNQLLRCISQCNKIVKFKAFDCNITEFGFDCISKMSLNELVLHRNFPSCLLRFSDPPSNSSEALKSFLKNLNKEKLKCLVLSECRGFDTSVFKELSKQYFPELETLFVGDCSVEFEKPHGIIKKLIENCPKLKNIHLKGKFDNKYNHLLIAMCKDSNISLKIHKSHCISFSMHYNYWF